MNFLEGICQKESMASGLFDKFRFPILPGPYRAEWLRQVFTERRMWPCLINQSFIKLTIPPSHLCPLEDLLVDREARTVFCAVSCRILQLGVRHGTATVRISAPYRRGTALIRAVPYRVPYFTLRRTVQGASSVRCAYDGGITARSWARRNQYGTWCGTG